MRNARMLLCALGVECAVVEDLRWVAGPVQSLSLCVRLTKKEARRCSECGRRCPRYDTGEGQRRWRTVDVGLSPAYVVTETVRVRCPEHGVTVERVPWARRGSRFTRAFEDRVAW